MGLKKYKEDKFFVWSVVAALLLAGSACTANTVKALECEKEGKLYIRPHYTVIGICVKVEK